MTLLEIGTIVVGTITTGGVAWLLALKPLLESFITKRINFGFDARLEIHKHELSLLSEHAKHDLAKRLTNANLYTTRRHSAYIEVYKEFRIAHGTIVSLRGFRTVSTFEDYNSVDLRAFFDSLEAPSGYTEELLKHFERDRAGAIESMKPYIRMLEQQMAERMLSTAKNTVYLNELFFSDEAVATINRFIEAGELTLIDLQHPGGEWPILHQSFTQALEAVHTLLRAELAAS